jgi:hypothetical protein
MISMIRFVQYVYEMATDEETLHAAAKLIGPTKRHGIKGTREATVSPQSTETGIRLEIIEEIHSKFGNIEMRAKLFAQADAIYCGESFRFLSALIDWECLSGRLV